MMFSDSDSNNLEEDDVVFSDSEESTVRNNFNLIKMNCDYLE